MLDSVINYLDKFGPELLVIQFGLLIILSTLFLWLWFSNRRKYHNLKHAIPANVVKSYLDSIIQNSTALKSQLFRGGGLDVGSVPSVMPLQNLGGGDGLAVSGAPSTALLEEINQKKALIASLESQLSSLQGSGREIEKKLSSTQSNLTSAEQKIKDLEALLAQTKAAHAGEGSGNAALETELNMVSKERDEYRDRLKEFEIIADDLANLKRLQQENEQLKKSLSEAGGSLPVSESYGSEQQPAKAAPTYESAPKEVDTNNILNQTDVSELLEDLGQNKNEPSADNQALEEFLSSPTETVAESSEEELAAPEEVAAASSEPAPESENKTKSEKTPEDLLSEFEKMLG